LRSEGYQAPVFRFILYPYRYYDEMNLDETRPDASARAEVQLWRAGASTRAERAERLADDLAGECAGPHRAPAGTRAAAHAVIPWE
jgi:hypothetical protein